MTLAPAISSEFAPSATSSSSRGMADAETLELVVAGQAPVQLLYARIGEGIYVLPSARPGTWFHGASREGSAQVRAPSEGIAERRQARVRFERPLLREVETAFRAKYGDVRWTRYFRAPAAVLELSRRIPEPPRTSLDRIRGEFEAVADGYDDAVARNPIERYLKERVATLGLRGLEGCDPILEIGPGTGFHTLRFLEVGHRVVAVDVSPRMLSKLRERAEARGLSPRLETRLGSTMELDATLRDIPDAGFGGAFAGFGPLELDADPRGVATVLARTLRAGAPLILTSINRPGWSAVTWDLALGRPSAAGSRIRSVIPPGRIRYPLELHPRAPRAWDELLRPGFERVSVDAISVLAPPFASERAIRFLGGLGSVRAREWDRRLVSRRWMWPAAEWLLLTYRRTGVR